MWDDRFQPTDTSNAERRFLTRLVNSGGHAEANVRQVRPERVTKRGDTKLIVLRWLARSRLWKNSARKPIDPPSTMNICLSAHRSRNSRTNSATHSKSWKRTRTWAWTTRRPSDCVIFSSVVSSRPRTPLPLVIPNLPDIRTRKKRRSPDARSPQASEPPSRIQRPRSSLPIPGSYPLSLVYCSFVHRIPVAWHP